MQAWQRERQCSRALTHSRGELPELGARDQGGCRCAAATGPRTARAPEAVSRGVDSSGNKGECGVEVGKTAEEAREEAPVAATVREDGAWTRGQDGEKGRQSGLLCSWCLSVGRWPRVAGAGS